MHTRIVRALFASLGKVWSQISHQAKTLESSSMTWIGLSEDLSLQRIKIFVRLSLIGSLSRAAMKPLLTTPLV